MRRLAASVTGKFSSVQARTLSTAASDPVLAQVRIHCPLIYPLTLHDLIYIEEFNY